MSQKSSKEVKKKEWKINKKNYDALGEYVKNMPLPKENPTSNQVGIEKLEFTFDYEESPIAQAVYKINEIIDFITSQDKNK